jgi:hypothetical protein
MPSGDIYEVLFDQTYGAQRLNTTFYLFQDSADGTGDPRENAIVGLHDLIQSAWSACTVATWDIVQGRARRITPTETQPFYKAYSDSGDQAGYGVAPQSVATISQKNSTSGKFGNGRVFLSGTPMDKQSNGRNTLAQMDLLSTLADLLVDPVVESGYTFSQGVWSKNATAFYKTTQVNVEGSLTSLRSRMPPADAGS